MQFDNVPNELKSVDQWVCWKEYGEDKRKVPVDPKTGKNASSSDQSTWGTFDQAVKHYRESGCAGIGFEFTEGGGFVGIDLDGCRDPVSGVNQDWAKKVVSAIGSYTEMSPSGTGLKIFARGGSPFESGRKVDLDFPGCGGKSSGIEVYDKGRYFAVTGLPVHGFKEMNQVDPEVIRREFESLPAIRPPSGTYTGGRNKIERAGLYLEKCDPAIAGASGHNTTFRVACTLILGFGLTPEEATPMFQEWNNTCQPPWSEKDLIRKLHEANKQSGERNYLANSKQEDWAGLVEHHIPTPKPKRADPRAATDCSDRAKSLDSACLEYIERLESGAGCLDSSGLLQLDEAIGGGFERGEMVIIAARPSQGKSCVVLQIIHNLCKIEPCLMISEEMTSYALGKRTIQYASDKPEEHWLRDIVDLKEDLRGHFMDRKPCYVVESVRTAENAAETIRKMHEKEGVQFAAIDYVQLLASAKGGRYETVTESSIILRQVANETGVTLFVLAQLNRGIEGRETFTPKMSDLKESGQLEQDADVVLFLVWPHRLDSENFDPKYYQVFIGKNRNREIVKAAIDFEFNASRQMIVPPPVQSHENYNDEFTDFG